MVMRQTGLDRSSRFRGFGWPRLDLLVLASSFTFHFLRLAPTGGSIPEWTLSQHIGARGARRSLLADVGSALAAVSSLTSYVLATALPVRSFACEII